MLTYEIYGGNINKSSVKTTKQKQSFGEVSEWFKELVLKTSDTERYRGFESHLLRSNHLFLDIWRSTQEAEGARLESE